MNVLLSVRIISVVTSACVLTVARVLSSALAVEVSSSWDTCASIEAGIRGTGTDSDFTVSAHERSSALTEIPYNTQ